MDKVFKVADIRKLERQVAKGEISYSKMIENLNYMAVVYFNTTYSIKKLDGTSNSFTDNCKCVPSPKQEIGSYQVWHCEQCDQRLTDKQ